MWDFSRRNKILHCNAYNIGESNPVPASGSGSKLNQFVHVPTSVDTQLFIQIHARVFESNLGNRQTDKRIYLLLCRR